MLIILRACREDTTLLVRYRLRFVLLGNKSLNSCRFNWHSAVRTYLVANERINDFYFSIIWVVLPGILANACMLTANNSSIGYSMMLANNS